MLVLEMGLHWLTCTAADVESAARLTQEGDDHRQRGGQEEWQIDCQLVLRREAELRQDAVVEECCLRCLRWDTAVSDLMKVHQR